MAGYRDLIHAAIVGNMVPFTRGDGVEAQWRVVEPVLGDVTPLHEYEPGTWGPAAAGRLTERHGGWSRPEGARGRIGRRGYCQHARCSGTSDVRSDTGSACLEALFPERGSRYPC